MIRAWARDQAGVAMVTVLFVGAVLTAVASGAAFVAIEEFRASRDHRSSAQALAYAEAGIDRMLLELRRSTGVTWNDIAVAGCTVSGVYYPPITRSGSVGNGTYSTTLNVFNSSAAVPADRVPGPGGIGGACTTASRDPVGVHEYVVTSTGTQPASRRIVRQVINISPLGLPVGIYAYESIQGKGTIKLQNISMVTGGFVTGREQMAFSGTDPYYSLAAFYGSGTSATTKIPAAVHAVGQITVSPGAKPEFEHPPEPNCNANPVNKGGTDGQSLWDGSGGAVQLTLATGCANWTVAPAPGPAVGSRPPTARFTEEDRKRVAPKPALEEQDYITLREAAKADGFHCSYLDTQGLNNRYSCTVRGGAPFTVTGAINAIDLGALVTDLPSVFVAYIDFPKSTPDPFAQFVEWKPSVTPCSETPSQNRSMVLVVRNGSVKFSGGAYLTGAILIPEGKVDSQGDFTNEGTIIAKRVEVNGTATIKLSECWVHNLPGPFLNVTPRSWSEIDR